MAENPGDILEEMDVLKYYNIASQESLLTNVFMSEAEIAENSPAIKVLTEMRDVAYLRGTDTAMYQNAQQRIDELVEGERKTMFNSLMDINSGARLTPSILLDDELNDIITLPVYYKVVYSPDGFSTSRFVNKNSRITNIIGAADSAEINDVLGAPSRDKPGLSAHLNQLPSVSPATRHSSAVQFFMNSIPPQEFSRCVPYIDVIIRTEGGREKSGLNTLRFLGFGPSDASSDTIGGRIASSIPQVFLDEAIELGVSAGASIASSVGGAAAASAIGALTGGDDVDDAQELLNDSAYSTMDIFTLPQSMIDYSNPSENHPLTGMQVLDRSRPFMSLKGMSVSHVSQRSATIYTVQIKLDLVLHDRSRLADISQLIAPRVYKTTKFLIEYGWSHPEGGPDSQNVYGRFLDSLRHKGIFFLVRSDYQFTQDGQVNVSVILQNASAVNLEEYSIAEGRVVPFGAVKESLLSAIGQSRTDAQQSVTAADALPEAILRSENVTSNAMMLPISVYRQVNSQINQALQEGSEISMDDVVEEITNILTNANPPSDEDPRSLFSVIDEKLQLFKADPEDMTLDPFLKKPITNDTDYNRISDDFTNRTKYVSFGRAILSLIGLPLAASQDFDEVQFHFHSFNHSAGALWGENISAFPMNLELLEARLKRKYQTKRNITVSDLFDFLAEDLETAAAIPYGISRAVRSEEADEEQTSETEDEDDVQIEDEELDSFLEARIARLGCPVAGEFITPSIVYIMETLAVASSESSSETADPGKTILRVHVVDTRQTPYTGETIAIRSLSREGVALSSTVTEDTSEEGVRRTQNNTAAVVNGEGVAETIEEQSGPSGYSTSRVNTSRSTLTPAEMSQRVASTVPSFIYGSNHSAITSLDVRGSTSGPLADALIMQSLLEERRAASGDTEAGQGATLGVDADLQLVPATITLNTLGCPLLAFGQQYFLSMGTGTTLEQIYGITRLTHTIGPGDFKSSATLYPTNSGRMVAQTTSLRSLRNLITEEAINARESSE